MLFSVILSVSLFALAHAGISVDDPVLEQLKSDRDAILLNLMSYIDRVRPKLTDMIDATTDIKNELASKDFATVHTNLIGIRGTARELGYETTRNQIQEIQNNLNQLTTRSNRRQREGTRDLELLGSFRTKMNAAYQIFEDHLSDPVTRCAQSHGDSSNDGWYVFENRCYRFFDNKVDFNTARSTCQGIGMDLVTLESQAQHDFLIDTVHLEGQRESNGYYVYWLGGNRPSTSDSFSWVVSGAPLSSGYQNWDIGEPNNLANENCLHIWRNDKWNDIPCSYVQKFACQDY